MFDVEFCLKCFCFIAATLGNGPSCYIMFFTVSRRVMWGNKGWMGHVGLRLSTKCQAMMIFRPPLATRSRDTQRIQILAATKHLVMLSVVSKYLQSASTLTIWHCGYLLFECCHFQAVFLLTSCKKKRVVSFSGPNKNPSTKLASEMSEKTFSVVVVFCMSLELWLFN